MAMPTREAIKTALMANMETLVDAVETAAKAQQPADRLLNATAGLEKFKASKPMMTDEELEAMKQALKDAMRAEDVYLKVGETLITIAVAAAKAYASGGGSLGGLLGTAAGTGETSGEVATEVIEGL